MDVDASTRGARAELVVIGASAGGVEALKDLVALLPAALASPVVVVLHLSSTGRSVLPEILDRAGALPSRTTDDGDALTPGIHVAPNSRHVVLTRTELRLDDGPPEHGLRPAADPTMRSAAEAWGKLALGVVLSGTGHDGAAGLAAIKAAGGRTLVQDPAEARYAAMPEHAIAQGPPDAVLTLAGLADRIAAWCAEPAQVGSEA